MGPRILTDAQISAYIDGELTPQEMQELRFQAEAYEPSQRLLDASVEAHESLKSLVRQVKADPAYERFQDMVLLHDFAVDTATSKTNSEFDAFLNLFPDRAELMKLLYRLAESAKDNTDIFRLLSRELDGLTRYMDRGSMDFAASESWSMKSASEPPAFMAEPYRPTILDRIESLIEVTTTYSEIADLYKEYGKGSRTRSYDELLTYCAHCLEQGDTENEDQIHHEINRLLSRIIRHPLRKLMQNAFNEETNAASVYRNLLKNYMDLIRRKDGEQ
mgnify:CR=1 FL=1